jgi:hypothetical protein
MVTIEDCWKNVKNACFTILLSAIDLLRKSVLLNLPGDQSIVRAG